MSSRMSVIASFYRRINLKHSVENYKNKTKSSKQEESLARMRVEDEKRREVADHFQECITSIQTQLNEYQTRNTDLRKENQDLADKLGDFIKHHEKREEHLQKIMQTRDLEVKLAEAKLNKMQCQMDQERVKAQHQVIRMEEEAKLMKERMDTHIDLETKLKEQIEFYKTKYKSFNKTMADSNRLFDSAKEEMEKSPVTFLSPHLLLEIIVLIQLGKRVRQAERDVVEWRGKWELSQRKLLELVEEHKKKTEEAEASKKRADRLTCLCRALQDQLSEMRKPNADVAREPDSATSVQPNGDGSNEVHTNNSEVVAQVCAPTTILEHSETNNCPSSTPHTLQSDRIERRKQTETVEPDESSASTVRPSTPVNEQTVQDEVLGDTTENPN
ncbi:Gamma taxilin [Fasciola gigantica]|uniref:Gamma taxilin n=1 Tax=Fasciola gigantica TaxID=46835 RepID=A0A504YYR9_FASGI|nr:Gamma taxilin [Fasciola gigantica]